MEITIAALSKIAKTFFFIFFPPFNEIFLYMKFLLEQHILAVLKQILFRLPFLIN